MVIEINPSRINSGAGGKADRRRQSLVPAGEMPPTPARAHVNFIPAPESLRTMISAGLDALRKGSRWDRGTILNLLV